MTALRSVLFLLVQVILTPLFALLMLLTAPLGSRGPRVMSGLWCRLMIESGRRLCGVRYDITGWEHLPKGPCVILAKHQSAWETMFFPAFFPPHAFVLKRELLRIPFFGWGLRLLQPIAIDRDQRKESFQQIQQQGLERLGAGLQVVIFPEGTRVPPGYRARYGQSGGALAAAAQVPIIPIAHDAGHLWKKGLFSKLPGTIHVRIGPPIRMDKPTGPHLTAAAEAWIESQMEDLTGIPAKPYHRKSRSLAARERPSPKKHRMVLGEMEVTYAVVRRAKRRSIGLQVDHGGLTVAIPPWVTLGAVEQAIRDQWPWIENKLRQWKNHPVLPPPQFHDGESLPWLGGWRTLRFVSVQMSLLPEPGEVIEVDPRLGAARHLVQDWYRAQALPILLSRVRIFAERMGVPLPRVRLSDARGRWGSCNEKGEIRLNWRLVKASMAEIDYVVAHEMAHLRHFNHGREFWALVAEIYPEHETASQLLNRNDPLYRQF